jgi:hypothetical protein
MTNTTFDWDQYDQDTKAMHEWVAEDQAREAAGLPQYSVVFDCPHPKMTPLQQKVHELANEWYDLQAARLENTEAADRILAKIRMLDPRCGLLPENGDPDGYNY